MSMMQKMRGLIPAVMTSVALAASAPALAQSAPPPPPAPGPQAPPGLRLTGECLTNIARITGDTVRDVGNRTRETIERIVTLRHNGAPPPVIAQAGENGKALIALRAAAGKGALNAEADRCLQMLQQIGAPQAFAEAIARARGGANEAIDRAKQAADRAINEAVARATAPAPTAAVDALN